MAYDLTTDPMYKIDLFKKVAREIRSETRFFFKQAETGTSVLQCCPFNKNCICAMSSHRLSSACKVVVRHVTSFADPTDTIEFSFLEDLRLGNSN